jgi:hypothetical protein
MKFLIDNYSTINNTEPLYLSNTINAIDGYSSSIYHQGNNMSVYDKFDSVNPDIYITHALLINHDTICYLKDKTSIQVVVNISGLNQEKLSQVETMLLHYDINSVLFFINYSNHNLTSSKFNIFVLHHGADVYLGRSKSISYSIDKCIMISSKSQITEREGTYHYVSTNNDLVNAVDIVMPTMYLSNIYPCYNSIIFKPFGKVIPQYFYDAVFYGNEVSYENDNENDPMIEIISNMFKDTNPKALKEIIKNKHTCLNRTKSLLSQLPCHTAVVKLGQLIERLQCQ